jgi:uncharacterized repeat protein (TIGR03803 family)
MKQGTSLRQFGLDPIRALSALVAMITLALMTPTVARAQSFTVLYRFCKAVTCASGESPTSLVQATDGAFYGTTTTGGTHDIPYCAGIAVVKGCGTVFKITPGGTLTSLRNFCDQLDCTDGALPSVGLIQATNGDFYGILDYGGLRVAEDCPQGCGTIFKITPSGKMTTLYKFCTLSNCADGEGPVAPLIQASNGDFYGTTQGGGNNPNCLSVGFIGCGTVFKITPDGELTTLYIFCSLPNCTDGGLPYAALIQAADGDLYGTTQYGGANDGCELGCGTVFKITLSGKLTTLHNFCSQPECAEGSAPVAPLIQGTNGDFYGTTSQGGTIFGGGGTVFEMTPSGTMITLYEFCSQVNCADGSAPASPLVQATNGDFYGTTTRGGSADYGTLFEVAPNGALTTLYNFCAVPNCTDGERPYSLMQATDGSLYGTTSRGGESDTGGIIFSLNVGLGPFIALQTTSGEVGAKVTILGTDLTGASSVTFNGAPARFIVDSTCTAITATVPAGATTGTVQVVTPRGTLNSNVAYRVRVYDGNDSGRGLSFERDNDKD